MPRISDPQIPQIKKIITADAVILGPSLMHLLIRLLTLAMLVTALSLPAHARRVALVVGNAAYAQQPLANPVNDANAIAEALTDLGFAKVIRADNASKSRMEQALAELAKESAGAEMAVVYFAGHGTERDGRNYLIPVDAKLERASDLALQAIALPDVIDQIAGATKLKLVILDACRNNVFPLAGNRRSAARGLARVEPEDNTLVAYAAKDGTVAADGEGQKHSPFTTALLKHIRTPGLEIRFLLAEVRDEVLTATGRIQQPHIYGTLGRERIVLKEGGSPPSPLQQQQSSAPTAAQLAWQSLASSTDIAELEAFVRQHSASVEASVARERILRLRQQQQQASLQQPQASVPAPSSPQARTTRGSITVGVAGPFSGPNSAFGEQMRKGAEQAASDLNSRGGINGLSINLSFGDDQSDPKEGVRVANIFEGNRTRLIIGHFNSGVSLPASEVYAENGALMISPSASNPKLTTRGLWNVFRTCGRDDKQGEVASKYLISAGKPVAFVHDKTTYGKGLADETRRNFTANGGQVALNEGVNVGDKDFSSLVSKIRASGAEFVYWGGLTTEGALIIKQLRTSGSRALLVSGDGIADNEFAAIAGTAAIGSLMTFPPEPRNRPEAAAVVRKFRNELNFDPQAYTLYTYAALEIIAAAAAKGNTTDPRRVASIIKDGTSWPTVIGPIGYDKNGDITRPDYTMYTWKRGADGKVTYVEN